MEVVLDYKSLGLVFCIWPSSVDATITSAQDFLKWAVSDKIPPPPHRGCFVLFYFVLFCFSVSEKKSGIPKTGKLARIPKQIWVK